MCVALHRDAAARGCEAFRERRARKTYLAVVEGAVDAEGIPRRGEEPDGWGEGKDGAGGRKRRPDSVQHTPAHGFFQRKKVRAGLRFAVCAASLTLALFTLYGMGGRYGG